MIFRSRLLQKNLFIKRQSTTSQYRSLHGFLASLLIASYFAANFGCDLVYKTCPDKSDTFFTINLAEIPLSVPKLEKINSRVP